MRTARISALFVIILLLSIPGCRTSDLLVPELSAASRDVYIVPDLPTYIHYISLWDADNQFPVFIGESEYTKKFLMSYGKARVSKVKPVDIGSINSELIYRALYASWGPEELADIKEEITKEKLRDRLKKLGRKPRGIVITNAADMEFAGGLALAAGHKQLLDFYQSNWPFNDSVNLPKMSVKYDEKEKIRRDLFLIVKSWGYGFGGLGDDIDYITLALDIQPGTYSYNPRQRKNTAGFSLDDAINRLSPDGFARDKNGKPFGQSNVYAYTGRLVEVDAGTALYQAMCSLFCPIERALYFDWWPPKWGRTCTAAAPVLRKKLDVTIYHRAGGIKADIVSWRSAMRKKNTRFDFVHVSATGKYDTWNKGTTDDIPDTKPVVVFFAHSNASRNPKNNETIIGRWLKNGAYITYGSIAEPYATAFSLPKDVAQSLVNGDPFGKAFQQKEKLPPALRIPWRLIYIGDPLRELEPECSQTR